jgi:hypothetical protein
MTYDTKLKISHTTSNNIINEEIDILKTSHEIIGKERRDKRREKERLRLLNRSDWQKEHDEYLDWYEKEEAREEMMEMIDIMTYKS